MFDGTGRSTVEIPRYKTEFGLESTVRDRVRFTFSIKGWCRSQKFYTISLSTGQQKQKKTLASNHQNLNLFRSQMCCRSGLKLYLSCRCFVWPGLNRTFSKYYVKLFGICLVVVLTCRCLHVLLVLM